MQIEQLKQILTTWPPAEQIYNSDHGYLYRDACDCLISSYNKIINDPLTSQAAIYLLPLLTLDDFEPEHTEPENSPLAAALAGALTSFRETPLQIKLLEYFQDEDDLLLQMIIFHRCNLPQTIVRENINRLSLKQKVNLLKLYFDQARLRPELDLFTYTFEGEIDYQTFQQLKAAPHNVLIMQPLTTAHGYLIPPLILDSNFHSEYIACMKKLIQLHHRVQKLLPLAAPGLIPCGARQRILLNINLNQLQKLTMDLAEDLWDKIRKVHPSIFQGIKKKPL